MSEWSYVTAAYVVSWIAIAGYRIYLTIRHRTAGRALQDSSFQGER